VRPALAITAEQISKQIEKDMLDLHIKTGGEKIPEHLLRLVARRAIFQLISEQMPNVHRKVRHKLAAVYEAQKWAEHKKSLEHLSPSAPLQGQVTALPKPADDVDASCLNNTSSNSVLEPEAN
jgi:hypothetical protein